MPGGEHASTPEVWKTGIGRVVATRHLGTGGGHVELRIVVRLPGAERAAVALMRWVIAAAYYLISRAPGAGAGASTQKRGRS